MVAQGDMAGGNIGNDDLESKRCVKSLRFWDGVTWATGVSQGAGGQIAPASVAAAEWNVFTIAASDELYFRVPKALWWDVDFRRDILAEIFYESAVAGDTGISFQLDVKGVGAAEAFTDAKVTPDGTALWTGLATNAVASAPSSSGLKPLNVQEKFATFADTIYPRRPSAEDLYLMFAFTAASIGTASADEIGIIDILLHCTWEPCHWRGERDAT
jgi:hypothetical protein